MKVLGIDVGGSSIKGGLVDVTTGKLLGEGHVPTPKPSAPEAVMKQVAVLGQQLPGAQAVGFAFPSVVKNNIARTAANVDHGWIGADGVKLARAALGLPAVFLNDADAAGLAEMRWGAGRDTPGTVIMLTFGTGIGTALFADGKLMPNTEFGHIQMHGADAEAWASARVRTEQNLDFRSLLSSSLSAVADSISLRRSTLSSEKEARLPSRDSSGMLDRGARGVGFVSV